MKGRFPYKHLAKYPRMAVQDVAIWNRFIKEYPNFADSVDYDLVVGNGVTLTNYTNKTIADNYQYLTKKRIDVVGYKSDIIYIIEVKPHAGLQALGQALGYITLYKDTVQHSGKIQGLIVTDRKNNDEQAAANSYGVRIFVV